MRHFILAALSCLSLTAAMPALREAMDERAVQNIIDDLVLHGETVDDLIKRIDPKIYRDEIPNCDEEDPSYHIPKHTGYAVDQGVKLPRDGDNDACTTGTGADHCWTEYFFVESAIEYSSWQDSGSAIDCRGTSMCHSDISQLGQHCVAHMNTHSNGVDWQIVEGKLEYSVPNTQAKVSVGSNVKYQHTDVEGETTTVCRTDSSTSRCQWNDEDCHQVWYADRTKRIWGHMSRVCVGQTSSEVQQQTQNANGRWVRGQAEFSIALPVNKIVGCNALCGQLSYDEPMPSDGITRVPFDLTFD